MDPNLLPQDLRSKEEKELARLKNQPRGFNVELHQPVEEKNTDLSRSDKPRIGFWSNLLGQPKVVLPTPKLSTPGLDYAKAQKMNWTGPEAKLAKDLKPRDVISTKPARKSREKGVGLFSSLFGSPRSPILKSSPSELIVEKSKIDSNLIGKGDSTFFPKDHAKPAEIVYTPAQKGIIPVSKEKKSKASRKSRTSDGWWDILKNLFGFRPKHDLSFHLASSQNGMSPKVVEPIVRQSVASLVSKSETAAKSEHHEKAKPSVKSHSPFHLVPKREASEEVNVNLMPFDLLSKEGKPKQGGELLAIILTAVIAVIFVAAGYGTVLLLQNDIKSKMVAKTQELNGLTQAIGDFTVREKQNNLVADRVSSISKLMANKIVWTNFFSLLEKYTLDDVYFTNLTADTSGILVLPGVASNYDVLAQQVAILDAAKDFIKDVKITNAQLYSEGKAGIVGVSFQLRLTLTDNVFKKTN